MMNRNNDGEVRRRDADARSGGLRHVMAVPAGIRWNSGGSIEAQIRDVSRDGMYLRHALLSERGDVDALRIGALVTVSVPADPAHGLDQDTAFSAEVVRRLPHGVGVRLLDMTREHVHVLRLLALLAVESRKATGTLGKANDRPPEEKRDVRLIMGSCRKVIERRLPNLIWTLRTETAKRLRLMNAADGEGKRVDTKGFAQTIEDKALAIGRTIERRVIQTFAEVGGLDDTQEVVLTHVQRANIKAASSGEKPILLDNKALDGHVAMHAAKQRFEAALAGKSFEVNVRLANVVGRRIDNIENPLVPGVMCRILWQAITAHVDSAHVQACLRETLVNHVIALLGDLYDDLDSTLDQQGVAKAFGRHEASATR